MEPINDTPISAIITPEGLQSAKFTSHIEEPGILYTDNEGTPLWFKIGAGKNGSIIVPTGKRINRMKSVVPLLLMSLLTITSLVYTLWKFPNLVPGLTTWNPVVDKLRNGADLMIPGVITANNTEVPDLEEGALVTIFARGNKYPLGVGTMAISARAIVSSRGSLPPRGKAVHILHVHDDQLWAMGTKSDLPADWSQGNKVPLDEEYESSGEEDDKDVGELANDLESASVTDRKGKARASDDQDPQHDVDNEDQALEERVVEAIVLSTEEVDRYLQDALLQVLKFKITEEVSKELLPMSSSTLYSSYVLPNRARGRAAEADIKKSSWKKLAKWLKAVEKQDLIKCKEVRGELVLLSINWGHSAYVECFIHGAVIFVVYSVSTNP
jgi:translation initiation factor 2D